MTSNRSPKNLIMKFQKDASEKGRDHTSIAEFKLWLEAREEKPDLSIFPYKTKNEDIEKDIEIEDPEEHDMAASKKEGTGEADQEYDHEFFDALVKEMEEAGIHGVTHREFDKYQGVYLRVPDVGKFWISDYYLKGVKPKEEKAKPYTKAVLVDEEGDEFSAMKEDSFLQEPDYVFEGFTLILIKQNGDVEEIENPTVSQLPDTTEVGGAFQYEKGTEMEIYVFSPESDSDIQLEVSYKNGIVSAEDLIDYCLSYVVPD